jgi:pilus assembly protein FimV
MEVQDEVSEKTAQTVASAISDISFDLDATADELVEDGLSLDLDSSSSVVSQESTNTSLPVDDVPTTKSSSKKRSAKDLKSIDLADSALIVSDTPADESEPIAKVDADETPSVGELDANEFDLSAISLDLDDALSDAGLEEISFDSPVTGDASLESQEVEIKLDLVAAYIDMDDMEGARELLEEVLKEGGPQQQARAQQLLDSLA